MRSQRAGAGAVLVTDAERPHGLAVIRSLGRAGRSVCAASHVPDCAAFRSRFAAERLVVPDPAAAPSAFVESIQARLARGDVRLVVPVTELSLVPLARARGVLEPRARLAAPSDEALGAALDKAETVALASRLGVPVPATRLVESGGDLAAARVALTLPIVLKPRRSVRLGDDGTAAAPPPVCYARRWEEAERYLGRYAGQSFLCQEAVFGTGVGVEGMFDRGRPLVLFQHRRLRELPLGGGGSTCRCSEPLDPALAEHARRIFGALGWTGVAMLELKRGRRQAWLIEINGRFWGSLPLAIAAGVDFPRLLADLLIDGSAAAPAGYRAGVVRVDLARDVEWMKAVLRRGDAGLAAPPPRLRAFDPVRDLLFRGARPDLWAPDDLGATLAEAAGVAKGLSRSIGRAFGPLRSLVR